MRPGQQPVDQQLRELTAMLCTSATFMRVLEGAAELGLPEHYVAAGAVVQTVWNVLTGRPAEAGIKDYDLAYFDDRDLSWAAEDAVIRAAAAAFAGLGVEVEVRNQARVHLWYEQRFGVACRPYRSVEDAIDSFQATTSCIGVRLQQDGGWRVYAPHGLADVFNLVVRPNPLLAPAAVYEAKARRWQAQWPQLSVLPWPAGATPPDAG